MGGMEFCPGCGAYVAVLNGRAMDHLRQTTAGWVSCPYGGQRWRDGSTGQQPMYPGWYTYQPASWIVVGGK